MSQTSQWSIPGDNPIATTLRAAARFVPIDAPISIATHPDQVTTDGYVLGPASLTAGDRVVPFYAAFEAIETLREALLADEAGRLYGLFGSFRLPRGASSAEVEHSALLPIVATALDLIPGEIARVWARCFTLFAADDAWFVTIRMADETLLTLEAIACNDPAAGRELLIEVTGSNQVLRAEPLKQAVVVERVGGPASAHPWWEDTAERYLQLLVRRSTAPDPTAGPRLRSIWNAIQQSATSGEPVRP